MLDAASEAGFSATGRLLTDWVSLGLLDQAQRRGLGRGKGTAATWPAEQLQLFLLLIQKRREVTRIAPLCNVPVSLWLWWGDRYVPTRQARRAIETWADARSVASSWRAARGTAEELVGKLAHAEASERARELLIDVIARSAIGKRFQATEVLAAVRRVFDPRGEGRAIGPPEFTAEHFVALVEWQLAAIAGLRDGALDDEAYEWARTEYRTSRPEYDAMLPRIAADAEASDFFLSRTAAGILLPPTFEEIVNQSCVDLLTLLGIYLRQVTTNGTIEDGGNRS
jgi:hypothetical protein